MSNPDPEIEALKGKLACSIDAAMVAIDVRRTRLYELIGEGKLETYMEGGRRKVVVASLVDYVEKQRNAARARKAA
jgi:hypothetical protein